jgi:hypothetical protein
VTWLISHCVHVWPQEDLLQHELSPDCPCGPTEETADREDGAPAFVFTHASLDGRERSE